jgi:hypothetical protein
MQERRRTCPVTEERFMDRYYVNKTAQDDGDHEFRKAGCGGIPDSEDRLHLGDFIEGG